MALTTCMVNTAKAKFLAGVFLASDTYKMALVKVGHAGTYDTLVTAAGTPGTGAPTTSNLGTDKADVSHETIAKGSYHPWIHGFKKTIEPEIVDAVIEVVDKVIEVRTIPNKEHDTALAEKQFRAFLRSQKKRWAVDYAQLIMLEYERREQESDDMQIAMLLFDM